MRRIVSAISAAALAFGMVAQALPANAAVPGYDSAYAGESAFLTLERGATGTFTVFFLNIGTTAWTRNSTSQVNLAACLEDKVTCNAQDATEAPFNSGWISTTVYTTHGEATVAPGKTGNFTYNVRVPAGQAGGTYRFNGAPVKADTGVDIHNEGYYQEVFVPGVAAATCTPTQITTTPLNAQNQVGLTHTQSATATCEPPAGSTTRPGSANLAITFVIDAPVGSLNSDLTLTATTDANGTASVTWSRTNPDRDDISVFPTSFPAVRATATKRWTAGASAISCEPTVAASQLSGSSRTFTVTVRNPNTGALSANTIVNLTTAANVAATVWRAPTTIAGIEMTGHVAGSAVPNVEVTTGAAGTAVFSLVGTLAATVTTGTITVRAYIDNDAAFGGDNDNTLDATEFRVDCGATTFESLRAATIAVTPDTAATNAVNGNRVYTVTALDQFGAAFANNDLRLRFSFSEFISGAGTTARRNSAFAGNAGVPGTQAGGTAPTARTDCPALVAGDQNFALPASTTGTWFVMICASAATTGTPLTWYDADNNQFPTSGEAQDTGGAKTWAASAITAAGLTPASATNAASTEDPVTNSNTPGEETYTAQLTDQSGNNFPPTAVAGADVTFTIRNTTGTGNIGITRCALSTAPDANAGTAALTIIAPNTTGTCVLNIPAASVATAQVEIDRGGGTAGTATIDVSITHGGVNFVGSQATKTWVATGTLASSARGGDVTATGTVVAFDRAQDYYTLSTTAGNFTIEYFVADRYTIDGSTANNATFESTTAATGLSIGDRITFRSNPIATDPHHALTNQ